MEYLFIYLLQFTHRIDALLQASIFTSVVTGVLGVVIYTVINNEDMSKKDEEKALKTVFEPFKKMFIISTVLVVLLSLVPTKNTLLLMGGTYLGKKAFNTVVTDSKIQKVNTIIEMELDKRIKELKTEVAENDK